VAGCCVLCVRKCGWILCAVGEGVWTGCCVLCVRKCGWMLGAVGEKVWLDIVCCG